MVYFKAVDWLVYCMERALQRRNEQERLDCNTTEFSICLLFSSYMYVGCLFCFILTCLLCRESFTNKKIIGKQERRIKKSIGRQLPAGDKNRTIASKTKILLASFFYFQEEMLPQLLQVFSTNNGIQNRHPSDPSHLGQSCCCGQKHKWIPPLSSTCPYRNVLPHTGKKLNT